MINGKPTDEQLQLTQEVLEWLCDYTEKNEPYAIHSIEMYHEVYLNIPESDDLEEM